MSSPTRRASPLLDDLPVDVAIGALGWATVRALGFDAASADRFAEPLTDTPGTVRTVGARLDLTDEPAGGPVLGTLAARLEAGTEPERRKTRGVHYTPQPLADGLAERAVATTARSVERIADPACGGGAFLLGAARALHRRGHDPIDIVTTQLFGVDLDPLAAAVARAELALWAAGLTGTLVAVPDAHVVVGDALADGPTGWPDAAAASVDVVVGNPPFASQLRQRTAREPKRARDVAARLGLGATGYADEAGLFLAAAVERVAPRGTVTLVLPTSILSARDAHPVRHRVAERCELVSVWAGAGGEFRASVQVWAPTLRRRSVPDAEPNRPASVRGATPRDAARADRTVGTHFAAAGTADAGLAGRSSWSHLVADLFGGIALAEDELARFIGPPLGSVARLTAGFRSLFYGIAPHTVAAADAAWDACDAAGDAADAADAGSTGWAPLLTSGSIDPLHDRSGRVASRFAGRDLARPLVDLEGLARDAPELHRWVQARRVPKVLVAPQGQVVEAVMDPLGRHVPSTPVISIEPTAATPEAVAHLAAALSSPPAAVWVHHQAAGSGLSARSVRLSARLLGTLPLPVDATAWARGAQLAHDAAAASTLGDASGWQQNLDELGVVMATAYGFTPDHPMVDWWRRSRPPWR